jgi:hypothetical protein
MGPSQQQSVTGEMALRLSPQKRWLPRRCPAILKREWPVHETFRPADKILYV